MITAILIMAASMPVIWGDGVHDDTDGMEALVCQQIFQYAPGALEITRDKNGQQHIDMSYRTYLLPRGFPVPKDTTLQLVQAPVGMQTYQIDCKARNVS